MLAQVVTGVVTGVAYAMAGWKKNKDTNDEWDDVKVDLWKLGKSVVVCGAVGAVAGYTGQDFSVLVTGAVGVGATKVVDMVWGFAKHHLEFLQ